MYIDAHVMLTITFTTVFTFLASIIMYVIAYYGGTIVDLSSHKEKIKEFKKHFDINEEEAEYIIENNEIYHKYWKQIIEEIVDKKLKKEKINVLP